MQYLLFITTNSSRPTLNAAYSFTALIFELFFMKYKELSSKLAVAVFSALAMEFHEKLQSLAAKEGLKGRKVSRALESFSWNITILKVSDTHTHMLSKTQTASGADH